jgi:hypothetical protein
MEKKVKEEKETESTKQSEISKVFNMVEKAWSKISIVGSDSNGVFDFAGNQLPVSKPSKLLAMFMTTDDHNLNPKPLKCLFFSTKLSLKLVSNIDHEPYLFKHIYVEQSDKLLLVSSIMQKLQ